MGVTGPDGPGCSPLGPVYRGQKTGGGGVAPAEGSGPVGVAAVDCRGTDLYGGSGAGSGEGPD